MQLNILDFIFIVAVLGAVLSACHRGLGREVLHTALFMVGVGGGVLFFRDMSVPTAPADLARLTLSVALGLAALYVFVWGCVKFVAPFIMQTEARNVRSQFWAGALSLAKIVTIILSLNLWYAVHSPEASPLRLAYMPQLLQNSAFIRISDRTTDDVYQTLAQQSFVNAEEFNRKIVDARQRDTSVLEQLGTGEEQTIPAYVPTAEVAEPLPEQRPEDLE